MTFSSSVISLSSLSARGSPVTTGTGFSAAFATIANVSTKNKNLDLMRFELEILPAGGVTTFLRVFTGGSRPDLRGKTAVCFVAHLARDVITARASVSV